MADLTPNNRQENWYKGIIDGSTTLTPNNRREYWYQGMIDGSTDLTPNNRREAWYKAIVDSKGGGGGSSKVTRLIYKNESFTGEANNGMYTFYDGTNWLNFIGYFPLNVVFDDVLYENVSPDSEEQFYGDPTFTDCPFVFVPNNGFYIAMPDAGPHSIEISGDYVLGSVEITNAASNSMFIDAPMLNLGDMYFASSLLSGETANIPVNLINGVGYVLVGINGEWSDPVWSSSSAKNVELYDGLNSPTFGTTFLKITNTSASVTLDVSESSPK